MAALWVSVPDLLASGQQPAPPSPGSRDTVLEAANAQIAARNLDSASTLLRRLAEAPDRPLADRVRAWVLLGVVAFYATGDSATAFAFRQALELDPGLEAAFDEVDPAIARILAAERAALASRAQPPPGETAPVVLLPVAAAPVQDCVGKCPEGVQPPQFTFFPPEIQFMNASVSLNDRRNRTYLTFRVIVGADGTIEPESVIMAGGSARNTEAELRRGLAQARFTPGRADGVRVRTRVTLRFDFEAEGTSRIKYTYRVVVR